ncbi:MAG: transposase [Dissulfuribacterales bacterium]
MRENQRYSQELKAEEIRMVVEQGLKQKDVAIKLSIPSGTIAGWLKSYKSPDALPMAGALSIQELMAENARLRKELAETRMKREILKKAAAYFAKESMPGTRS